MIRPRQETDNRSGDSSAPTPAGQAPDDPRLEAVAQALRDEWRGMSPYQSREMAKAALAAADAVSAEGEGLPEGWLAEQERRLEKNLIEAGPRVSPWYESDRQLGRALREIRRSQARTAPPAAEDDGGQG